MALDIHTAKLEIKTFSDQKMIFEEQLAVYGEMRVAIFVVSLDSGLHQILTSFVDRKRDECGAYYLEVHGHQRSKCKSTS